jgi:hypothetical protein
MNAARPSSYVLVLLSAGRGAFTLEAVCDETRRAPVIVISPSRGSLKGRRPVNNPRWELREVPRSQGQSTPLSG